VTTPSSLILSRTYEENWISQEFISLVKQCRYSIRSKYGLTQVFRGFPFENATKPRRGVEWKKRTLCNRGGKLVPEIKENIPASEPQSVTVFSIALVPLECQAQFDNSAQTQCPDSSTSPNSPSQARLQLRTTSRIISPREQAQAGPPTRHPPLECTASDPRAITVEGRAIGDWYADGKAQG
jgi:hypothetical protein